jgi:hypothetical protein
MLVVSSYLITYRTYRCNFQDEGKFDPRSIPLKSWNDYVRATEFLSIRYDLLAI